MTDGNKVQEIIHSFSSTQKHYRCVTTNTVKTFTKSFVKVQ